MVQGWDLGTDEETAQSWGDQGPKSPQIYQTNRLGSVSRRKGDGPWGKFMEVGGTRALEQGSRMLERAGEARCAGGREKRLKVTASGWGSVE